MIELGGDELKIRLETRLHARNQLFGFEPMRLLCSDSERVGVDRAVLLSRQMFGRLGRQPINCRDKLKRRMRPREAMTFHQVFRKQ